MPDINQQSANPFFMFFTIPIKGKILKRRLEEMKKNKLFLLVISAVLLVSLLPGCTQPPEAAPVAQEEALKFGPGCSGR